MLKEFSRKFFFFQAEDGIRDGIGKKPLENQLRLHWHAKTGHFQFDALRIGPKQHRQRFSPAGDDEKRGPAVVSKPGRRQRTKYLPAAYRNRQRYRSSVHDTVKLGFDHFSFSL